MFDGCRPFRRLLDVRNEAQISHGDYLALTAHLAVCRDCASVADADLVLAAGLCEEIGAVPDADFNAAVYEAVAAQPEEFDPTLVLEAPRSTSAVRVRFLWQMAFGAALTMPLTALVLALSLRPQPARTGITAPPPGISVRNLASGYGSGASRAAFAGPALQAVPSAQLKRADARGSGRR
ncbi:MAG: hypothetical protein KGJ62_13070 [Armatimonadetes bacterium]|nr:hypothetical protein [Armatimonadota bacterium]MDE2206143.1 hypothetical protein [Armatimonadota bacterium]